MSYLISEARVKTTQYDKVTLVMYIITIVVVKAQTNIDFSI